MIKVKVPYKIFGEDIEKDALNQFFSALDNEWVVQWALMPDAHSWYSLPIGWVVATKWVIVPAWVWFDIGCWVCSLKTQFKKSQIENHKEDIFNSIYRTIPTWEWNKNSIPQIWDEYKNLTMTNVLKNIFDKEWLLQLGTLWWGNHFIEIWYDKNDFVWITVHSWSRWVWYKVADYYMKAARWLSIDVSELESRYEKEHENLKRKNLEKYWELKEKYIQRKIAEASSANSYWHFSLDINSKLGKDYIIDMNFCLSFALKNRELMIEKVLKEISYYILGDKTISIDFAKLELKWEFINRNHNHADFKDWLWIHRKWATHAEQWMYWVIPGNMRDWVFIVKWKWHIESLYSSSHWAWRILSRSQAKDKINIDDFKKTMKWIVAKVEESTKDESPFAYKDIFKVIDLQSSMIEIIEYIKPIINIKWIWKLK